MGKPDEVLRRDDAIDGEPWATLIVHFVQLTLHYGQLSLESAPLKTTDTRNNDGEECYYASANCRPIPIFGVPPIYVGAVFSVFGVAFLCLSLRLRD